MSIFLIGTGFVLMIYGVSLFMSSFRKGAQKEYGAKVNQVYVPVNPDTFRHDMPAGPKIEGTVNDNMYFGYTAGNELTNGANNTAFGYTFRPKGTDGK